MTFKQFLGDTTSKNKYDYSSLLVKLPEYIADDIISWGWNRISNESIFINNDDPSFGRDDDPHITLMYGIHTDSLKKVSELFVEEKEFECKLGKIDLFTKSDKFDVLIVSVECEELHRLNKKMRINLTATEHYPVYVPHVTICYMQKGKGQKYIGNEIFLNEKFTINEILFSSKNGDKTPIKLGSK